MTRRTSESGFTLLEVLVASMLLAMLITILTMVFNSSSIAWTMGKAGVADMATVRNNLSAADAAKLIQKTFDKKVVINNDIGVYFYIDRRNNPTEEDRLVIRRRLTFTTYLYER